MRTIKTLIVLLALSGLVLGCGSKDEKKPVEGAAATTEKATTDEANKEEAPAAAPKATAEVAALKGIAVTVLNAYKAKDIAKMAQFAPAEAQEMVKSLKAGDAMYDRMFDETNWRWKAASGWDGKLQGVRIKGAEEAWVKYAELAGDEIAVVKLKKKDGKWLFDDFSSPDKKRWSEWGEEKH